MKSKYCNLLLLLLLLFLQATFPVNSQSTSTERTHTVKIGETVYSISRTYDVFTEDIYRLNPEARQGIKPNQVLKIPAIKEEVIIDSDSYVLHSIQPKETLYSVSKHYNISIQDILAINPGLNADNFRVGNAIRIPKEGFTGNTIQSTIAEITSDLPVHKVKAKETLYSISKQYNISMQEIAEANPAIKNDGLKKDMLLIIPTQNIIPISSTVYESQSIQPEVSIRENEVMKIGLLLPFLDQPENLKSRFIEYYEGFLLAVEDIKAKGYSAEIYTFDISKGKDSRKLTSLLDTYEMRNLNLIIGGVTDEEITILSQFAEKNNIAYAIPFPVRNNNAIKGNNSIQINIPQTSLYSKVADRFSRLFKDYNIIIATDENYGNNDKRDFVDILKQTLDSNGVIYRNVQLASSMSTELNYILSDTKRNIIVPASSSLNTLSKLIPQVKTVKSEKPELTINLFGYPDWQTYSVQYLQDFYRYGTYIYTTFYADTKNIRVEDFTNRYRNWYNKNMINTYPKYGMLGYDTGMFFMTALAQNNNSLNINLTNLNIPSLQSAFYFEESSDNDGYINTGLYFIHYTTYNTIEKLDYSK